MLRCIEEQKIALVLAEVHKGECSIHIGGRYMTHKLSKVGYYCPSLMRDITTFFKKCDKCQRHVNLLHVPSKLLYYVTMPWPSYHRGVDIVWPFPMSPGQLKFLIVGVNYLTKWIEVEVVSKIMGGRFHYFYWKKIVCKFGLPKIIFSDNEIQFSSTTMINCYKDMRVQINFY